MRILERRGRFTVPRHIVAQRGRPNSLYKDRRYASSSTCVYPEVPKWACSNRVDETPWFCRRLELLDSDQGLVGPLCIVERRFEFGGRNVTEVAV